jgi:hypothetical protein
LAHGAVWLTADGARDRNRLNRGRPDAHRERSVSACWGSSDNNSHYFETARAGFTDIFVGVKLPISMLDRRVTLSPRVGYAGLLDGGLRDQHHSNDNVVYGGTVEVRF